MRVSYVIGVLASLSFCGCQGSAAILKAREAGEGESRVYLVSKGQAWDIAKQVLVWEGSSSVEEHSEENYLMASFSMNLVSWGSNAGVWIETSAENASTVTVICKRKLATNVATVMTETTFHRWFSKGVEIIKSGKALPEQRPEAE